MSELRQQEILNELRAIRAALEANAVYAQLRHEALMRATSQRDQAFSEAVSAHVQELRNRIASRSQSPTISRHYLADLLSAPEQAEHLATLLCAKNQREE